MTGTAIPDSRMAGILRFLADYEQYLLLDTAQTDERNTRSLLFLEPVDYLFCPTDADRREFLARLEGLLREGWYLAGWFAYEFFHDGRVSRPQKTTSPLAGFGCYREPLLYDHARGWGTLPESRPDAGLESGGYRLRNLSPNMERDQYCRAIRTILDYIAAGDTYQVNYTCKMRFDFSGSVTDLYLDLRRSQPVPYGCLLREKDRYLLSFSPELFFRTAPGSVIARPMKGTMARGRTLAEDREQVRYLQSDEKNRSENVMIVDLLRNDLTRLVSQLGGGRVTVASLFDVERYRTVLQMTSTITASHSSPDGPTVSALIESLFPCGSVTGAPKIRTMEIIDELEIEPRGVYTGAIGYFSPDGQAVFNVPIRTVVIEKNRGEMGIGSGIVADSTPEQEWRECLLKARFLTHPPPVFGLRETLLFDPADGYLFLDDHLDRLADSAEYFSFLFDRKKLCEELEAFRQGVDRGGCLRVQMTLSRSGETALQATPCTCPQNLTLQAAVAAGDPIPIGLSETRLDSANVWLYHKTTRREVYDRAHAQARAAGLFDVLFRNERGEITEGCITNIIVQQGACFFTPPVASGLLAGVMRNRLLAGAVPVREKVILVEDLLSAERIFVCNSVRGVLPARLRISELPATG